MSVYYVGLFYKIEILFGANSASFQWNVNLVEEPNICIRIEPVILTIATILRNICNEIWSDSISRVRL